MAKKSKRSIHAVKRLKIGTFLKKEDLIFKRPGFGIEPYKWKSIIGKMLLKNIKKDYWIRWQDIKK